MKILLVNPHTGRGEAAVYPLGLSYVAGALGAHEVRGCDLQLADDPEKTLVDLLEEVRPDVVGLALRNVDSSASYDLYNYFPAFKRCVELIGEHRGEVPLIVGGPGFSIFPEVIMETLPAVDFGVLFEGETSLPDLLDNLDSPWEVPGTFYREGETLRRTAPRDCADFEKLPAPDRTLFPLRNYGKSGIQVGIQTKRGCAFHCIYCSYPYLDGREIRLRDADDVVDELEGLEGEGVTEAFFCDSIFNYPAGHAFEICKKIKERGLSLKWKAFFNEKFISRELVSLARDAGCTTFVFGPDGGHGDTLKSYRKGLTAAQLKKAYDICRDEKVTFKCAFMMNGPGERLSTLIGTCRLILSLRLTSHLKFSMSTMRIYPHTELHSKALERGIVSPGDNLLLPRFYDPPPLRAATAVIHLFERLAYRISHFVSS